MAKRVPNSQLKRTDHRAVLRIAVFGVLTIASVGLFLFGMVNNSNGAVERFDRLTAVDEAGGDVEQALTELRDYIYSHMNTELGGPNGIYPPIQLSGTYQRLIAEEEARVERTNEKVRNDADRICAERHPAGQIQQRAACNADYIEDNSVSERVIDDAFYKFNYVAPRWSPDLAGFSMIAIAVFGFAFTYNILLHFRTKRLIRLGN